MIENGSEIIASIAFYHYATAYTIPISSCFRVMYTHKRNTNRGNNHSKFCKNKQLSLFVNHFIISHLFSLANKAPSQNKHTHYKYHYFIDHSLDSIPMKWWGPEHFMDKSICNQIKLLYKHCILCKESWYTTSIVMKRRQDSVPTINCGKICGYWVCIQIMYTLCSNWMRHSTHSHTQSNFMRWIYSCSPPSLFPFLLFKACYVCYSFPHIVMIHVVFIGSG